MSSPAPLALFLVLSLLLLFTGAAVSSPVKFDQRQDGELNVRADLENFVILVVPTSRANLGLLDLLSKTAPAKSLKRKLQPKERERDPDKQHFIESKTAPYHVDLTKSETGELAREVQIVESTTVTGDGSPKRSRKAFVVSSGDYAGKRSRVDQNSVGDEETEPKGELVLIGATEQCGPGMVRDHEGICRRIKV